MYVRHSVLMSRPHRFWGNGRPRWLFMQPVPPQGNALRRRRLTAPMVADEPMDGEMFLAYARKFLCPTPRPGDIVILDNLSSHKVAGVEEAITATGSTVLYLPPYSPDLNPIEKFFSKLKALLCKAAKRSNDDLWKELGRLLDGVTQSECENYFGGCPTQG
jgi:transposase